ncbi:MAG: DNA translocase FtsK 4TM domain-containing protein [Anderseniella sp.]
MPRSRTAKPAQTTIPQGLKLFVRRRVMELQGFVLLGCLVALTVALATWSSSDPSWSNAVETHVRNALGYPGAIISDKLISWFALSNSVIIGIPAFWAITLISHNRLGNWQTRAPSWLAAIVSSAMVLAFLPISENWPIGPGFGGVVGDSGAMLLTSLPRVLGFGSIATFAGFTLALTVFVWTALLALGSSPSQALRALKSIKKPTVMIGSKALNASTRLAHSVGSLRDRYQAEEDDEPARPRRRLAENLRREPQSEDETGLLSRLKNRRQADHDDATSTDPEAKPIPAFLARSAPLSDNRIEPRLSRTDTAEHTAPGEPTLDAPAKPSGIAAPGTAASRVQPAAKPVKKGSRIAKDMQPDMLPNNGEFQLPPLSLLMEPDISSQANQLSADALEQNARMLEGVLEDFGIRGEIINVRPGPVVTLYELEPAPGIKSSRVIGLADDIARSMCAISVRVAVVPGRNAIGIEMPNSNRETVYLRELLASRDFEKTKQKLAMALGKDIGGEPSFADLARMPHLLIAGTTGSGKSVGINTMILSLLFRLPPDKCKLIMIDPKMLELSVYEGIPHLLAPVVTDPHKAVISLKWAVREMEERYRKMSKLGVRNIDGYNSRAEQAQKKGEVFTRQIQTGFDPESGAPIYEEEQMDLSPLPYIVVIIDEMADLMMVAGKDIEGAVQRLAQMARAAGIHVIMATQRPSVDVITGTIKANFPTRISFQVTSKIDSRTILGEQGAEQLLGQGDNLFMAGGGRISRLHAPFVSDDEVEQIVAYLKTQAAPDYVDAVTEDTGEDSDGGFDTGAPGGNSGDEQYDKAVAVVLRDRKVSTSYIQRRLSIGYNKAASLIERMEDEGLISAANHAGKREILVGEDMG